MRGEVCERMSAGAGNPTALAWLWCSSCLLPLGFQHTSSAQSCSVDAARTRAGAGAGAGARGEAPMGGWGGLKRWLGRRGCCTRESAL